jgi:hypothetical protein
MSLIQVGLVDTTGTLDPKVVQEVAAALNVQVTRDLPQFWNIQATVRYLPDPKQIPSGVWPIQLVAKLPPDEGGYHQTKHNQPFAKVIASRNDTTWSIDASHETIEMLVDPFGNKLQSSRAIEIAGDTVRDGTGEFEYLVEACDPCEADDCAYPIQGFAVSDFITPHYYDPTVTPGTRYSFNGKITAPRQLLRGGYISFVNVESDQIQQILWVDPTVPPQLKILGAAQGKSLRQFVDSKTHAQTLKHRKPNALLAAECEAHLSRLHKIATARSALYSST